MDSYYLDSLPQHIYTEKGEPNFDHPEAFDWELLLKHLKQLKSGVAIEPPVYNFATNQRLQKHSQPVGPCEILLFEGIFTLFNKDIRDILDIKCFLQVDADIRFTRRLHRDIQDRGRSMQSVIAQYYDTVRPMYQKFLDPQRQHADFIVGEETDIAADILSSKVQSILSNEILSANISLDHEQLH